ncbi:MAG: hypothetical protein M1825_005833 [Sarcosagium campestre]|nr:MAG: hypothetical protein M1825_005833 [Sarcosagium campestre]
MSTLAPLSGHRQALGSLGSRFDALDRIRNTQHILHTPVRSSVKRALPVDDDEIDSENIDPSSLASYKRSKTPAGPRKTPLAKICRDFDTTPSPGARVDNYATPTKISVFRADAAPRTSAVPYPQGNPKALKPRLPALKGPPSSRAIPPAAGRSPTGKRTGPLRLKRSAAPFTRVDPPQVVREAGLSLDALLKGPTAAAPVTPAAAVATLEETPMRKEWIFEIHEETAEETLTNLMEFSASHLDIKEVAAVSAAEEAEANKENISPAAALDEAFVVEPTSAPVTGLSGGKAADAASTGKERSPLVDLAIETAAEEES